MNRTSKISPFFWLINSNLLNRGTEGSIVLSKFLFSISWQLTVYYQKVFGWRKYKISCLDGTNKFDQFASNILARALADVLSFV